MNTSQTRVHFQEGLEGLSGTGDLLLWDSGADSDLLDDFLKKCSMHALRVEGGERAKEPDSFAALVRRVAEAEDVVGPLRTIVVLGGGATLDAGALLASLWRRGTPVVLVPSTWLAAVDACVGGKTALNAYGKNRLGTYWPAKDVVLCRKLLETCDDPRALVSVRGEIAKCALISGLPEWSLPLSSDALFPVWSFVEPCVSLKQKIVSDDPREETGRRKILNLGHTMGHVLETWSGADTRENHLHGVMVGWGLVFAAQFSRELGYLREPDFRIISRFLDRACPWTENGRPPMIPREEIRRLLVVDKKRTVFGDPEFVFLSSGSEVRALCGKPTRIVSCAHATCRAVVNAVDPDRLLDSADKWIRSYL